MFNDKSILVTGGTGSFGKAFISRLLAEFKPKRIIVYSRDEYKQYLMQKQFAAHADVMRYFIGDVRDKDRLARAFVGVDIVIHAAALKQVPAAEYNPIEAVKTNIHGAVNIIDAAIDRGVKRVVALSTDKAVSPVNLYGATKLVSDKLFVSANAYSGREGTVFNVVRYGNVVGSRGSVVPFFKSLIDRGEKKLPITDFNMTRFWITLDQGIDLVCRAMSEGKGGEIFVAKIPSCLMTDLARAMLPDAELVPVGIREGEKLHEVMITAEDSRNTYEYDKTYIIYPHFDWWDLKRHFTEGGKKVAPGFSYASDTNPVRIGVDQIRALLKTVTISI